MEFHPIANAFPLLEGAAFENLVRDIETTGLLEPIWLYEGQILDGRNRYRACQRLGKPCATWEYQGDDPIGFVISMNLTRRHLDESQRAMVAARLATMRGGRPQKTVEISTVSREQAAELLRVSPASISAATRVQQYGSIALNNAVDTGELAVSAAAPLTALPRETQDLALTEARTQAKGGKVTATITREVVSKKDVLATLQQALEEGLEPSSAIKQALKTHDIGLPTPGLADALARACPTPMSIPATDGYFHDGRTPEEERDRKDYVKQLFQLFRALEALATLPDPSELVDDIPDYSAFRIDTHLEAALGWLTAFADLWRHTHGERHPINAHFAGSD